MSTWMRPLPTRYAGHRFRSRLEARWAVFFNALGVTWHDEPEGFELRPMPAGLHRQWEQHGWTPCTDPDETCTCFQHRGGYLPDFWLPSINTWFEVKGQPVADDDGARLQRFDTMCTSRRQRFIVAVGPLPDPAEPSYPYPPYPARPENQGHGLFRGYCRDSEYAWTLCGTCGKPDITWEGRSDRVRCHPGSTAPDTPAVPPDVTRAYDAARNARFEHGQSGATSREYR
jgi:hypothetical protein